MVWYVMRWIIITNSHDTAYSLKAFDHCRVENLDIRTTGESARGGARRDGGAGPGRAAQDAHGTVRPGENRPSYLFPRQWKNDFLGVSLEARTKQTLCKPTEEQKLRLTTGDNRFITGLSPGREALFVPGFLEC